MGKKGGDTRVKRQMAPTFWAIKRKQSQFVLRVKPGPHPKHRAYPLGMVLRDVLKVASTMHEAQRILNAGKVKVDGTVRRDSNLAVGLMDVVELATGQAYRMVPKNSALLDSIAIEQSEKGVKLVKVTSKATIKGKKIQYGFHDGKTLISDQKLKVGDTCVIDLPKVQVKDHIVFEKGATALIITGENAGTVGKIEDIQDGIFSLPKRALVSFDGKSVELPVEMVMVVGKDKPVIKVN
ncbi:30S ribosomal protein S4e [Candidatus Nitrososphaera gargensis Ga9.2]|uniref:Small ribosomal subunit protein eS4 n=2 Tax=Candidatus Nitrososphaera gargensis TaxID=497727 RepID=K0IN33_NITGG